EHFGEALVRVAARVGRRARQADVLELDLTDVQGVKSFDHRAVHPPSTTSVCPVTYDAASPHRNTAQAATSSIVPRRSAGVIAFTAASSPPTPRITGASSPRMRAVLASLQRLTSAWMKVARPPAPVMAATVSLPPSGSKSTTATGAPAFASAVAIPRPRPEPPPVTTAQPATIPLTRESPSCSRR